MTEPKQEIIALEELTGANIVSVLETLPEMGRVMVIAKNDRGVTHERIGPVEAITTVAGGLRLAGACHDSLVDPSAAVNVQIDRSSVMRDKVYPHLQFLDEAGEVVLAVVGMEGTEPMDAALSEFKKKPSGKAAVKRVSPAVDRENTPEIPESDPGMALLNGLSALGDEVTITAKTAGIKQVWQGSIEVVNPAMGFINVMTSDFHLHLKAGSVSSWAEEPGQRIALDAGGQEIGLTVAASSLA